MTKRRHGEGVEVSSVPSPGLADFLRRAEQDAVPPSMAEAVESARMVEAREHLTVETVFTAGENPLTTVRPTIAHRVTGAADWRVLWVTPDDSDPWFVAAWPSGHSGVFQMASTVHSTDGRWRQFLGWLGRSQGVVRTFLNHEDFTSIGSRLSAYGDVEVSRVTARSVLDGSSDARGWQAGEPGSRPSHLDVIRMMEDQYYSVRTMTVRVGDVLTAHLRRMAGATYYSGDFGVFQSDVLGPMADSVAERRRLLIDRQRKPEVRVRPLSLTLPAALLVDAASTGSVIDEVAALTRTSVAVFHRNPYLHFTVTDDNDGSNFDVMVTEASEIQIFPGFRTTPSAFARLVDHLADRFGAVALQEQALRAWTLDELTLS